MDLVSLIALCDEAQTLEPEMLTIEYREALCKQISAHYRNGEFINAKTMLMRLSLIELQIVQIYADMDAGARQKLDMEIHTARTTGKQISRRFLKCAADRYLRIIDRMELDGQTSNPALVEYLNTYATVLELLGDQQGAQRVHDRIPVVMLAMLEHQKAQTTRFCLAEKEYWDGRIVLLSNQKGLSTEELQIARKALRFYEQKEAILCVITHSEDIVTAKLKLLKELLCETRAA